MKRTDRVYAKTFAQEKGHSSLVTETRSLKLDRQKASVKRQLKPTFDTSAALRFLKDQ